MHAACSDNCGPLKAAELLPCIEYPPGAPHEAPPSFSYTCRSVLLPCFCSLGRFFCGAFSLHRPLPRLPWEFSDGWSEANTQMPPHGAEGWQVTAWLHFSSLNRPHVQGGSPFTRAMFSPRPTLSLTLLMSLAGGQSPRTAPSPHSSPQPPPATLQSSHLVLQADLGSNDIGSPADYTESQVLLRTRLGQATLVLPGSRLWAGTAGVTHGPGPQVTRDLRGGGQDQRIGRNE